MRSIRQKFFARVTLLIMLPMSVACKQQP